MAEHCIGKNGTLTCSGCYGRLPREWDPGQERGLQWVWAAAKAVWPLGPESCETTIVFMFLDGPGFPGKKKKKGWLNSNPKYRSPLRPCVYIPKYCIKTRNASFSSLEKSCLCFGAKVSLWRGGRRCASCPINSSYPNFRVPILQCNLCMQKWYLALTVLAQEELGHCWNALSHLFSHTLVCCLC